MVSHTFSVFEFKLPPFTVFKRKDYSPKIESPYVNMSIKLENIPKSIVLFKIKK